MKREHIFGTAAALIAGGIAIGLFKRRATPVAPRAVPFQIDPAIAIRNERPAILPPPPPPGKFFTNMEISRVDRKFLPDRPIDAPAFGWDKERNEDPEIGLEDYLNLPLEGTGLTHRNRHAYKDAEEGADEAPRIMRFQFFRLKVVRTRDAAAATAAIGGLMFMNGTDDVYHPEAKVWNPHTGARETFLPAAGWSDSDQRELIVKFPMAVAVNRYRLRTSEQDTAFDPVEWRLEGSQNGVYWLPLDERKTGVLPAARGVWVAFSMLGLKD
jgi:hypothetical protein